MATFRIHEDQEKENRILLASKSSQGNANFKEKRPTLGTLNNLPKNGREVGEKAIFRDSKAFMKQSVKLNNENAVPNKKYEKKQEANGFIADDHFKAFSVYEDSKENNGVLAKKEDNSIDEKRNPLAEIKGDILVTPMSVGELLSPMSVDKSMIIDDEKTLMPRNDRERFFEVEEYQHDILLYLKEAEKLHRPKPFYMSKQPDINHSMRTILVDWLVEVSEEYRLHSETLCLAISYIDRFLSFMSVVRAKLQLVGTAAMFIAAKYEEIYPPDVGEFVYITDDTYTKTQVLRMEQLILKVLSFDLSVPTTLVFTTTYCVMNDVPDKVKFMTMYLCELSLLDTDPYLQYAPSKVSAAALALSRYTLELPIWSKSLENNTGYTLVDDLKEIILNLSTLHHNAGELAQQAIQEKYRATKYMQVSSVSPCEITDDIFENKINIEPATENNESVRQILSSLLVT